MKRTKKAILILAVICSIAIPSIPSILHAQDREYTIRPLYPDTSRPPGSAGTYTNPYTVRERYDGNLEIKPLYPDMRQRTSEPGSYNNPWIIKQR